MQKVKEIVGSILKDHAVDTVYFVGCGGSLAGFFPAKYFLSCEAAKLKVGYINANEFVHATPKEIGPGAVVILASQRGNTPETVKACQVAREKGAATVGLTFQVPSPLSEAAEYVILYEFGDGSVVEYQKSSYGFKLAVELLNEIEGYAEYDKLLDGLKKMDGIVKKACKEIVPYAIKYAWEFKDDSVIYTMGSGASWGSAHQESICIFMEMQWINSSVIHSGEYFHGPFEITDKNTAFLMMKSSGRTRALDDRALTFMKKFNDRCMILDGLDYGMGELGDVSEYLDPFFHTNVVRVFNNLLADVRNHPLSVRRYMWKFDY